MPQKRFSYTACNELLKAINEERPTDDYEGATDCPEGCVVEVDGWCPHGWHSAAGTLMQEGV